jgi:hypothetical protein
MAQWLAIEAKLNDYDDNNTLGQIFAGFFPLDDNQILRKFPANSYRTGRPSVLVTGLPRTGLSFMSSTALRPFFSVQDLANIAPAAGGTDAKDLANIEPAAGGNTAPQVMTGACWGNVGGGAVSLDLGDDATSILADQAACGS